MSFNTLLYVDEPVEGNELEGQPTGTFRRTGRKAWFEVKSHGVREMQSNVSHALRCAYFPGANSRMRLSQGEDANNPTRVFNVNSVVNENDARRWLVWMCTEVA